MGVKSTVELTRAEAEAKYVDLVEQLRRRMTRAEAVMLDDRRLEDLLEAMNDALNDGEGFDNFAIVPDNFKK